MKDPTTEGLKELARIIALFIISALLIGIEAQIGLIPEEYRGIVLFAVTFALRAVEKANYERSKQTGERTLQLPF